MVWVPCPGADSCSQLTALMNSLPAQHHNSSTVEHVASLRPSAAPTIFLFDTKYIILVVLFLRISVKLRQLLAKKTFGWRLPVFSFQMWSISFLPVDFSIHFSLIIDQDLTACNINLNNGAVYRCDLMFHPEWIVKTVVRCSKIQSSEYLSWSRIRNGTQHSWKNLIKLEYFVLFSSSFCLIFERQR